MNPFILPSVVGAGMFTIALERHFRKKAELKYKQSYRYIRILPRNTTQSDVQRIIRLMANLHEYKRTKRDQFTKGKEWFRLLMHKNLDGNLNIYLGFPEDRQTGIKIALKNIYPDTDLIDVGHDEVPLRLDQEGKVEEGAVVSGGYFDLERKGKDMGYSLNTYQGRDDLEDIMYCLGAEEKGTETWFDVVISPVPNTQLSKVVEKSVKGIYERYGGGGKSSGTTDMSWQAFKDAFYNNGAKGKSPKPNRGTKVSLASLDPDDQERIKSLRKRYTGRETAFTVSIRLLSRAKYADARVQTAANAIKTTFYLDNGVRLVKKRGMDKLVLDSAPIPESSQLIIMNGEELGNVFRLPRGEHRIYQSVIHLGKGQRLLKDNELASGIKIGRMFHPAAKGREIRIPVRTLTKHFLCSGKSGYGKSSLILELCDSILIDFINNTKNAPGLTLFDPAQETIATMLNRLCYYEKAGYKVDWSRVHYISFVDPEYSLPLNILHRQYNESVDEMTNEVMDLITSAYGQAVQMERILRNALSTLMHDTTQEHNLLGILPLLTDERFRERVLPHVNDIYIRQFWKKEFPALAKDESKLVGPLLNRLAPFQTNRDMRRMIGQHSMGLQIRKWMDEGHIIFFDIKGMSEQNIKLNGGYAALQYHKAAQTRSTGSRPHILLYDEAHRTQFEIMEKIIAEDRKFGLCLGLSTQYLHQMKPGVIDALTEVAGNVFTAKQGPKSAPTISRVTEGHFDAEFLQGLQERQLAIYTSDKDETGKLVTATTVVECDPPYLYDPNGDGEWANHEDGEEMRKAISWGLSKGRELMKRDFTPVHAVDDMIEEYLEAGSILKKQAALKAKPEEQPAASLNKKAPPMLKRKQSQASDQTVAANGTNIERTSRNRWES